VNVFETIRKKDQTAGYQSHYPVAGSGEKHPGEENAENNAHYRSQYEYLHTHGEVLFLIGSSFGAAAKHAIVKVGSAQSRKRSQQIILMRPPRNVKRIRSAR
jgi:hypothetical protein